MENRNIISELQKAFGNKCQDMFELDSKMTALYGRPMFDIFKLMDWCEAEGLGDGESMEDFLTKKFGKSRERLIEEALGLA